MATSNRSLRFCTETFGRAMRPSIRRDSPYFGDRETDLAFTEFFGGFSRDFYDTYNEALPLHSGYERRKTLYNLYHCLNHFNLFGSGYAPQAQAMIDELLGR
jgi:protein-ribulosamine 3-kinase